MSEFPKIQSFDLVGPENSSLVGSPIASATTIAPDHGIHHVTGVAAIETVTIPWTGFSGTIYLIADGLFTWLNTGNIASAGSVGSTGQVLQLTYDPTNAKWYPALLPISVISSAPAFSAITSGTNTAAAMVVGTGASLAFTGTSTLATASTVVSEFSGQTNISGPDATTNVEIGSTANDANAGTGGTSVVIGNSAAGGNFTGQTIVGSGATTGAANVTAIGINAVGGASNGTAVGASAVAGTNGVSIGLSSNANASGAVSIGVSATTNTGANNTTIGTSTTGPSGGSGVTIGSGSAGATNSFVSGASAVAINNVYFGKGVTNATATVYAINGTGGSGADNAGGGLTLAGGKGTGTAAGGNVVLQASQRIATGSTAQTLYDRHVVVAGTKTLTAGAATGVVRIGVPQGLAGPIGCTIYYSVRAADAADFQLRRGSVHIAAVNKAGTETAVISAASEAADGSVLAQSSASTLTYALTVASNAADTVDFEINAASGLTETTLDVAYQVLVDHGTGTITPL